MVRLADLATRAHVMRALGERGIPSRPYFPPIHLQPFYRADFGFRPGEFPISEAAGDTCLALPFFGTMREAPVDTVCGALARDPRGAPQRRRRRRARRIAEGRSRAPEKPPCPFSSAIVTPSASRPTSGSPRPPTCSPSRCASTSRPHPHWVALALVTLPLLLACKLVGFWSARLFGGSWRHVSVQDVEDIARGNILASIALPDRDGLHPRALYGFPRSVFLIDLLLCTLSMSAIRIGIRLAHERGERTHGPAHRDARDHRRRRLGRHQAPAGDRAAPAPAGRRRRLRRRRPAEDRPPRLRRAGARPHRRSAGAPGREHDVGEVLIALPEAPGAVIRRVVQHCTAAHVRHRVLPTLGELVDGPRDVHADARGEGRRPAGARSGAARPAARAAPRRRQDRARDRRRRLDRLGALPPGRRLRAGAPRPLRSPRERHVRPRDGAPHALSGRRARARARRRAPGRPARRASSPPRRPTWSSTPPPTSTCRSPS